MPLIRFARNRVHAACCEVATPMAVHFERAITRSAKAARVAAALAWVGAAALMSPAPAAAAEAAAPIKATAPSPVAVVRVDGAWVRPTVHGQTATGGFMSLTADRELTLVGFSTPAARETELHEMVMDGDVMRMRAIAALKLPAGQTVTLKPGPGGQHLMLMGLKKPIVAGQKVVLTLQLRTPEGRLVRQVVQVPAQASAAAGGAATGAASDVHGEHAGHPMGEHQHGHDMKHRK